MKFRDVIVLVLFVLPTISGRFPGTSNVLIADSVCKDSGAPEFKVEVSGEGAANFRGEVFLGDMRLLSLRNIFHPGFYPGSSVTYKKRIASDKDGWQGMEYGVNDPNGLRCGYKAVLMVKDTTIKYRFSADAFEGHKFGHVLAWVFLNQSLFNRNGFGPSYQDIVSSEGAGSFGKLTRVEYKNVLGTFRFKFTGFAGNENRGTAQAWHLSDFAGTHYSAPKPFGFQISTLFTSGVAEKVKYGFEIEFIPGDHLAIRKQIAECDRLGQEFRKAKDFTKNKAFSVFFRNLSQIHAMLPKLSGNTAKVEKLLEENRRLAKTILLDRRVYTTDNRRIVPHPQKVDYRSGSYVFDDRSVIVLPEHPDTYLQTAANDIKNDLSRRFNLNIDIIETGKISPSARPVYINAATAENPLKNKNLPKNREGYILSIRPDVIELTGSTPEGAIRGAQSVIMLLGKRDDANIDAPCCLVRDWPDIAFRSATLETRGQDMTRRTYNALQYAIIRFKCNAVFFDANCFALKNSPITEDSYKAVPPDMIRDLGKIANRHAVKPIPFVQMIGHSANILSLRPDLSESQDKTKPGSTYCMTDPKVKKFLAGLIDESLELFDHPDAFFIGGDEAPLFGQCEQCKKSNAGELYANQANWAVDYLKKRGVKDVFLCHDMLLDAQDPRWSGTVAHSNGPVYKNSTHTAIDTLYKDIIIVFWSYSETGRFPAIRYFQDKGFRVVGMAWMQDDNAYDMAGAVHENKAYGVSTWPSSLVEGVPNLYLSENAWSAGNPAFDQISYNQNEIINRLSSRLPSDFVGTKTLPVDIAPQCNRSLENSGSDDALQWNPATPNIDLRLLQTGEIKLGGMNFHIIPPDENGGKQCLSVGTAPNTPEMVKGIQINQMAQSLVFLQTATGDDEGPGKLGNKAGEYRIHYADGSSAAAEIKTLGNIIRSFKNMPPPLDWRNYQHRGTLLDARQIWRGYSIGGEPMDLQAYEWMNPFPEKKIASLDIVAAPEIKNYTIHLIALSAVK